jgi:hypothetical protein
VEISRCERDTCKTFWFALECWTLGVALGIHACDFGACARAERKRETWELKVQLVARVYATCNTVTCLRPTVSDAFIRHVFFLQRNHDDNWE